MAHVLYNYSAINTELLSILSQHYQKYKNVIEIQSIDSVGKGSQHLLKY